MMDDIDPTPLSALRHGAYCPRQCGLIGKADVVEFEPDGTPYPVEYKHGLRHEARRHRRVR